MFVLQDNKECIANEAAGQGRFSHRQLQDQRTANSKRGCGDYTDAEVDERSGNLLNGLGDLTHAQVRLQCTTNLEQEQGEFTDLQLVKQRQVNQVAGRGNVVYAKLQAHDRQRRAHAASGLGPIVTSELVTRAAEAAEAAITEKQHAVEEVDLKLRKAWLEYWGPIFVHGSPGGRPPSFPPGPIPIAPPPTDDAISAVLACMAPSCSKTFSIFNWRHSCGVCRATTCNDCIVAYPGLRDSPRICTHCRSLCDEWSELHGNTDSDWGTQKARAQVDAANAARETSRLAQDEFQAAEQAERVRVAAKVAAREKKEAAEREKKADALARRKAKERADKAKRDAKDKAENAARRAIEEARLAANRAAERARRAADEAARVKLQQFVEAAQKERQVLRDRKLAEMRAAVMAKMLVAEVATVERAAATVAEVFVDQPFLLEFQVPADLERQVDAADRAQANLQSCNDSIRGTHRQRASSRRRSTEEAPKAQKDDDCRASPSPEMDGFSFDAITEMLRVCGDEIGEKLAGLLGKGTSSPSRVKKLVSRVMKAHTKELINSGATKISSQTGCTADELQTDMDALFTAVWATHPNADLNEPDHIRLAVVTMFEDAAQACDARSSRRSGRDDDAVHALVTARNEARQQYAISAAALVSASDAICGRRREHAVSAQLLFTQVEPSLEIMICHSTLVRSATCPVDQPAALVVQNVQAAADELQEAKLLRLNREAGRSELQEQAERLGLDLEDARRLSREAQYADAEKAGNALLAQECESSATDAPSVLLQSDGAAVDVTNAIEESREARTKSEEARTKLELKPAGHPSTDWLVRIGDLFGVAMPSSATSDGDSAHASVDGAPMVPRGSIDTQFNVTNGSDGESSLFSATVPRFRVDTLFSMTDVNDSGDDSDLFTHQSTPETSVGNMRIKATDPTAADRRQHRFARKRHCLASNPFASLVQNTSEWDISSPLAPTTHMKGETKGETSAAAPATADTSALEITNDSDDLFDIDPTILADLQDMTVSPVELSEALPQQVHVIIEAVRWIRQAAALAGPRCDEIKRVAAHHQALLEVIEPWVSPDAATQLLASTKEARKGKKRARKELKMAQVKLDTVDSDDDADSVRLETDVATAKKLYAKAVRADIQAQAKMAGVTRDHFPEFAAMSESSDPIFALMDKLGGVPVYESRVHYKLGARISGGAHEVQKANNTASATQGGSAVVLKRFLLGDAKSRKTFEKELKTLARLSHPRVIQLTGVVYDKLEAVAYLELPYLPGGNLRDHFGASDEHRSKAQVQLTFIDLLRALEYLHSNGVVHFDVKPDNILIDGKGSATLTDFDISKDVSARTQSAGATSTTTKAVSGMTVGYAAPEVIAVASTSVLVQAGAQDAPGFPADIWAAGCVLFFMMFYPKEIDAQKAPAVQLPRRCDTVLRELLGQMWRRNPLERPSAPEIMSAEYLVEQSQRALSARAEKADSNAATAAAAAAAATIAAAAPVYWVARRLEVAAPTRRYDVTAAMKGPLEWLMRATCKSQYRSRGRDNAGANFGEFKVANVWRIENHYVWRSYVNKRDEIRADGRARKVRLSPAVATARFNSPYGALMDRDSNEQLLFHGTKSSNVDVVCDRGFDERISKLHGWFGAGNYFTENSSKADEYVPTDGKQYMFLCRVALGLPFVTPNKHQNIRRPPCERGHFDSTDYPPCGHPRHDSLLATCQTIDPVSFLPRYREFVVYEKSQCYLEFLIEYKRLPGK